MPLQSEAQYEQLEHDILVTHQEEFASWVEAGELVLIADAYNVPQVPDYWVWATAMTKDAYVNGVSVDGSTFDWTGGGFIGRSQGERDAWRELFDVQGMVNPSRANVRKAFGDIFSGPTAPAQANLAHLLSMSRRLALRIERLFATGSGAPALPGQLVYEGTVDHWDIMHALTGGPLP